ncbi:phage holin family protein [Acinetobacter guillouiae]|uniref:phage holin family protein n=1 Tax=Acinetobacter guillouiae TaxID=106649 RepID=UPI0028D59D53|nr:phage holin family protein [Acinetobacter guillouiae]
METLYSIVAFALYVAIALRIICFNSEIAHQHKAHEIIAFGLIASLIGQAINILLYKDPVTAMDVLVASFLFIIVFNAKGNIALLLRSKS